MFLDRNKRAHITSTVITVSYGLALDSLTYSPATYLRQSGFLLWLSSRHTSPAGVIAYRQLAYTVGYDSGRPVTASPFGSTAIGRSYASRLSILAPPVGSHRMNASTNNILRVTSMSGSCGAPTRTQHKCCRLPATYIWHETLTYDSHSQSRVCRARSTIQDHECSAWVFSLPFGGRQDHRS